MRRRAAIITGMRPLVPLALASLAAFAFFAACGGDDGDTAPTTAEDVAPDLVAALGVPATLHSEPAVETFGPDGGTLDLADGATLTVPEGAFDEDTELTVAIIDLDYGEDVESARVYRVSPAGGLPVLRAPLLLETAEVVELPQDERRNLHGSVLFLIVGKTHYATITGKPGRGLWS